MIAILVFLLILFHLHNTHAVTYLNPCDRMKSNVTVLQLYHEMQTIWDLNITRSWLADPMRFVDCSKRGLTRVPRTIPVNVQVLDLSLNSIHELHSRDLQRLPQLQVLWLCLNCLGFSSTKHFCKKPGSFDRTVFSFLSNLKALNIAGNSLMSFPENLPSSLEYLDISETAITNISRNEISSLKNLAAFIAQAMCSYKDCDYDFKIENDCFKTLPVKLLNLAGNNGIFKLFSQMFLDEILYVNLARTSTLILGADAFDGVISVRMLDLYVQKLNVNFKLVLEKGVFDNLTYLEHLDLSCNFIHYLPAEVFRHNHHLTYLDLSGNCLKHLVMNPTFIASKQITHLFLGYNRCYFSRNQGTTKSKNFIDKPKSLGPFFLTLTKLKVLSFGPPKKLNSRIFSGPNIIPILNNESISVLQTLQSLQSFLFDNTYVTALDLTAVSCIKSLRYIDLTKNEISNLSSSGMGSTGVAEITMSGDNDKLELECSLEYHLILSYNRINRLKSILLAYSNLSKLDLSFNLISSIPDKLFKHMPCLREIDFRNNPILFFHQKSFDGLPLLSWLFIRSTSVIRSQKPLHFLKHFHHQVNLQLAASGSSLFQSLIHLSTRNIKVEEINLSGNLVPSIRSLDFGLKHFTRATKLSLAGCGIFYMPPIPIPALVYLDLGNNEILRLSTETFQNLPKLLTLILSHNKIKHLSLGLFNQTRSLDYLDVSNNLIRTISTESFHKILPKLKVLHLQNNYLFRLSLETFSLPSLQQLELLDLRWNSLECSCEIAQNFGIWLQTDSFDLRQRPGFLPKCQPPASFGFFDCVTCSLANGNQAAVEQPLVSYATQSECISWFSVALLTIHLGCFLIFTASGVFGASSRTRLWLLKLTAKSVIERSRDPDEVDRATLFAFHAFILFDINEQLVGDWVDNDLLPKLTETLPSFKIVVTGRDDQCGASPVKELLLKIEASRKVVVVLSGGYGKSPNGRYALSVLENLEYQTATDRLVVVTFGPISHDGGLLRKRRNNKPWAVLKFPEDARESEIFWECLCNALTSS